MDFGFDYPGFQFDHDVQAMQHVIVERSVDLVLHHKLARAALSIRIVRQETKSSIAPTNANKEVTVYFDRNRADLAAEESEKLNLFKRGETVVVFGSASSEGPPEHNEALARRRAERVAEVLEGKGVRVDRIVSLGSQSCAEAIDLSKCRNSHVQKIVPHEEPAEP